MEPSGAADLTAALNPALEPRIRGRRIAIICTGANLSPAQIRAAVMTGEQRGWLPRLADLREVDRLQTECWASAGAVV